MKYPVGTKCWQARSIIPENVGLQVTVTSHYDPYDHVPCDFCGSRWTGVQTTNPHCDGKLWLSCCCCLIPIDDPDAGKAVEEDLALPFDPRKIGEPA